MKRFVLVISCIFCSVMLFSQTIDFVKTRHDYGKINEDDGVAYYDFEFVNNGDAPLIIKKVNSSCGCTTPEWTKAPVAPGKKGSIKVGFNPSGRPNKFSKSITVISNAKIQTVVLQITGFVNPHIKTIDEIYRIQVGDLRMEKTHISFGRLLLESSLTDTLKFLNKGLIEANVTIENSKPFINFKFEPASVKPNEIGNIIITYFPKLRNDWGFVNDRFTLSINGKPDYTNQISVSGSIEEDYSKLSKNEIENSPRAEFNQTVYDFGGAFPEGSPVEFDFVVTNTGKSDLIIRKVKASCGCTTVNPSKNVIKPGESSSIKAQFKTNGYSGRQSKSITVITNDPIRPTQVLRLTGTIEKNKDKIGVITLLNDKIKFDKAFVNKTYTDTIVYQNTGKVDAKVTISNKLPDYVNVSYIPETVKPKQRGNIIITYLPQKRNDWGQVDDFFAISINGARTELKFNVSANIQEDFTALDKKQLKNAPKANFDKTAISINPDNIQPIIFALTNKGKSPLAIRKVSSSSPLLEVAADKKIIDAGERYDLIVKPVEASKISKGFSSNITVITNDPVLPVATLSIVAAEK